MHSAFSNRGSNKLTFRLTSEGWAHIYRKEEREEKHTDRGNSMCKGPEVRWNLACTGNPMGARVTDTQYTGKGPHVMSVEREVGIDRTRAVVHAKDFMI